MLSRSLFDELERFVPSAAFELLVAKEQRAIPAIAKDSAIVSEIERSIADIATEHRLYVGDSRSLDFVPDESVHLVVTSPPYWTLKEYLPHDAQLGAVEDYEDFLDQLDRVWAHCLRVLVPGGRLVVVVGDVCLSRRQYGRHVVFPLHASIQERCRKLGFDNLAPIIWHKIANARLEVENGSSFLGKPYEPGGVIKNDIEYVLFQRKPGGYRSPSLSARALSVIPEDRHREWFQQIWSGVTGASTRNHPAPYPVHLAERLVRMFSFVGDTVLDPFMGTGSTNLAAAMWGRDSIGVELHAEYFEMAWKRLSGHDRAKLICGE
ncbi:MAG: site-specific DNA-methyltransferase [Ilumatobacteraceae bacterium]